MTEVRCAHCGGDDVYRTVISYWSKDRGAWIDDHLTEELHCDECGGNEFEIWEDAPVVRIERPIVVGSDRDMDEILDEAFAAVFRGEKE